MLAVSQPHWVCPCSRRVCFPCLHCLSSRLLCQELSEAGPRLYALPGSKLLRFRHSGSPQRRRLGWACVLRPSQVRATQVSGVWRSRLLRLIASPVPAARFSGCTTGAPSQADVDDHPESQEVLVLLTKPACSLVNDASLGPRLSPSSSGCLRLPVSSGEWAARSRLALVSALFCEWAWR